MNSLLYWAASNLSHARKQHLAATGSEGLSGRGWAYPCAVIFSVQKNRPLFTTALSTCSPSVLMPAMGSKRLDSISDYSRHGFNLRVVCQGCGRAVVLDSLALSMARSKEGKSRDMLKVERDLRCRACGSRRVKCGPVELLPGERLP